jgi:hypothetical protein
MCIDPFGRIDFSQIAGADLLCRGQLALDERSGSGLAKTGKRARHMFFGRVVARHDGCSRMDPRIEHCGLPGHYPAEVASHLLVEREAPVVELRHVLSSYLWGKRRRTCTTGEPVLAARRILRVKKSDLPPRKTIADPKFRTKSTT